jgi:hypothetical protein
MVLTGLSATSDVKEGKVVVFDRESFKKLTEFSVSQAVCVGKLLSSPENLIYRLEFFK